MWFRERSTFGTRVGRRAGPAEAGRVRRRIPAVRFTLVASLALSSLATPAAAQPLTERTPNLSGPWVSTPWTLHFQFAHRFQVTGRGDDVTDIFGDGSIVNYPTFDLAYGLPGGLLTGFRYSSNSLIASQANEWQPYLKWAPMRAEGDGRVALSVLGAWNGGTQSVDGEVAARTTAGPLLLSAAARGFTDAFDLPAGRDDEALALAGGAGLRLNRYLLLAGDVADVVAGPDGPAAWSAGLHVGIPYTPHTVSVIATNVTSGTLEGTSTGVDDAVFWGFEFTVPFSGFARWGRIFSPEELREEGGEAAADPAGERVVEVEISGLAYGRSELRVPPGTTVRWVNRDPVGHTVTSDGGRFDSDLLGPGETWERTFDEPGRYPYHCTPHPFMQASVVVSEDP